MTLMPGDAAATLLESTIHGGWLTPEQRWLLACKILGWNEAEAPRHGASWVFRQNETKFLAEVLEFWPTGPAFVATLQAFAAAPPEQVLEVLGQLVPEEGLVRHMIDEARALGPRSLNARVILGTQTRVMAFYTDWAAKHHS